MRRIMQATGALTTALVLGALLLDEGEVVTLTTVEEGRAYETQLWVARLEGREYLRASSPNARWLARLRNHPEVRLSAAAEAREAGRVYRARPTGDAALRDRVNRAMAAKYGLADRLWGLVADRRAALPIALEPVPAEVPPARRPPAGQGGPS